MPDPVYITAISKFLPNRPVLNEDMESYLGMIDGRPSRARRIVLKNNGIKTRYYALDRGGRPTHDNATLAAEAIKGLFSDRFRKEDMQLLVCGTASPDQLIPSHASMVHGKLGAGDMEMASFAASCCASMQALKYAAFSVASGNTANAVCTGSEMLSHWMLSTFFENENVAESRLRENPLLAFEKEFLRWMLSDGAGALLLESVPAGSPSLRIEWIEIRSFAGRMDTCMYAGADRDADGNLAGWCRYSPDEWLSRSVFSLKQDTRMLGEHIVALGNEFLLDIIRRRNFDIGSIDYFLPHLSSEFFRKPILEQLEKSGIPIPEEKWFTNLDHVGNVATASFILMLEELAATRALLKGQRILIQVPESARFTYAFALLTVC